MTNLFLLAALLLLPPTTRPTAQLVVTCAAGSRQCVLDGSGSTNAVNFAFDFGTGQPPETRAKVTNTFPVGSWCVRLLVFDSAGASSYATKQVVVPYVAGTKFGACSTKPAPPIRVDTVIVTSPPIHDTVVVKLPAPPPIHDTIRVPSPAIHDTIQLPPRTDTLRITDTITVSTALPILPNGISITDPNADREVRWNGQKVGRLVLRSDGLVEAYRFNPAVTFGQLGYKSQGAFPTQIEAIAALLLPAPQGWKP